MDTSSIRQADRLVAGRPCAPEGKVIAMGQDVRTQSSDNRGYQEQFAHSLVASLGWEEAVYACQANTWDGVLEILLQERFKR
jgi:hypothetical protein